MTARARGVLSVVAVAVCCAGGKPAHGSGFSLTEQSAEGIAMASAVSASTTEPAAVWYNPAALSFMPGWQASLFGNLYLGQPSFSPRDGGPSVDARPMRQPVPGLFLTGRVSDRVGVGLGVYVPFGLGIEWPDDWAGREYGIKSSITTVSINPVASVKVLPNLSLAAGVGVMRSAVDITNGLPAAVGGGSVRIGGGTWGAGANAAVLYRAVPEKLHFAATYHSRVKLTFSGRAHFEVNEPVFAPTLFDQAGTATITLPDEIQLGVMFRPRPQVTLELDANVVLWSTYKKIPLDFSDPRTPDSAFYPNYHDQVSLRLGVDWRTPVRGLHVRGGFIYDQNPAPRSGVSPTLPDSTALDVCLGLGWASRFVRADLGYMLITYLPSKARYPTDPAAPPQSPEGTYHTLAHQLGLTITLRYGTPAAAPVAGR
jgi:long-chain fatty acid transport protein